MIVYCKVNNKIQTMVVWLYFDIKHTTKQLRTKSSQISKLSAHRPFVSLVTIMSLDKMNVSSRVS